MDKNLLKKLKAYFEKRSDVVMAFIFGSFVSGRQMKESDVDIAVYFKKRTENKKAENEISLDIVRILKRSVDFISLNAAPATLFSEILKTGEILTNKDKKLYWQLYLEKTLEAEDFVQFSREYYDIYKKAKSLTAEQESNLLKKIQFVDSELEELEKFKKISFTNYMEDKDKRRNMERWNENIINANIDIAKIVLASGKEKKPDTYEDALFYFGIKAGLTEAEAKQYAGYARLRNLLAHEYLDILYRKTQEFIKDFPDIYTKISAFLEKYLKESL